ncbi:MAG: helix-turn-helix transcriptional regulator [Pseudomonadota bacterium]
MTSIKTDDNMKCTTWDELEQELFTPEQIAASDVRVAIISKLIEARDAQALSQRALAEKAGMKQPVLARLERGMVNPQLNTLIRLLHPLGYTLDVVPLKENVPA